MIARSRPVPDFGCARGFLASNHTAPGNKCLRYAKAASLHSLLFRVLENQERLLWFPAALGVHWCEQVWRPPGRDTSRGRVRPEGSRGLTASTPAFSPNCNVSARPASHRAWPLRPHFCPPPTCPPAQSCHSCWLILLGSQLTM